MLQLKLVEETPSLAQIGLNLYCPEEPFPGFGDLTLTPEQPDTCKKKKMHLKTERSPENFNAFIYCKLSR